GARQAVAEQRLVGGVDVGPLADVDRGDERGAGIGEDRLALVFAQLGPAGRRGTLGDGTEVGKLDHEHLHVRSELAAPAGEELAHAVAVAGMPTSLSPWYQAAPLRRIGPSGAIIQLCMIPMPALASHGARGGMSRTSPIE